MALGFLRDERSHFSGEIIRRESSVEIDDDVATIERFKGNLFAYTMGHQLSRIIAQRVVFNLKIFRAVRTHNQKAFGADAVSQRTEQIGTRRVGSMQIFEQQYDGRLGGDHAQEIA